jgi:tetratricopeptide (TPR) repeat protein
MFFALTPLAFSGCAAPELPSVGEERPEGEANEVVERANESIAEHDRLFLEARDLYEQSLRAIEEGEGDPEREAERIGRARETMGEARARLEESREALGRVEDLDVAPELKEYARRLSEAAAVRSEAEAREMEYYEILEEDPILRENRDRALDALEEARRGYEEADRAFDRAEAVARENPDLFEET